MICSFFGHKNTPCAIYPQLTDCIESLIINRGVSSFMVGNQGEFDSMVLKVLRELNQKYPYLCYRVVLAYIPYEHRGYEAYDPSETFLPDGIEAVPKRFAVSWRNRWIVKKPDMVICYITRSWGGAVQFAEYAAKQGKEVINLADRVKP